jgi:Hint domain
MAVERLVMKRPGNTGTRRQLFRVMAAGAASVPFLVLKSRSGQALGFNPAPGAHPSCLLRGVAVSTPSGDRPVEDLQIGDDVHTLSGRRAIKWIGYSKFTKDEGRPWQETVMPIRVARSAIDDETPHRDLYLSPEHCVFFNGVLIPVKYLVNQVSVVPAVPPDMTAIEYYHIEFEAHEVIRAEGALVESFLDEKNSRREFFSNFVQYERLYGRPDQPRMTPFAPVLRYRTRRQKMTGLARSVISSVVDVRDPIQVARDHLARRAEATLV